MLPCARSRIFLAPAIVHIAERDGLPSTSAGRAGNRGRISAADGDIC